MRLLRIMHGHLQNNNVSMKCEYKQAPLTINNDL